MSDVIYLVVADFPWADYHVNRPICWFDTAPEATARAERMTVASAKWMPICQQACVGDAYVKASAAARAEIGDDEWLHIRRIRYQVCVVPKGTP